MTIEMVMIWRVQSSIEPNSVSSGASYASTCVILYPPAADFFRWPTIVPPMPMMQVRIADGVLIHEQEGEAFLLHTSSGKYFGLNKAGVTIWHALSAGEDPVAALGQRWPDVPIENRARDAEALIGHLLAAALVVPAAD